MAVWSGTVRVPVEGYSAKNFPFAHSAELSTISRFEAITATERVVRLGLYVLNGSLSS